MIILSTIICFSIFFFSLQARVSFGDKQAGLTFFIQKPVASAVTRYRNKIKRVLGVLETILQDKEYLVASKCTIADLSFVNWNVFLPFLFAGGKFKFKKDMPQLEFEKEFPNTYA
ncbi:glutathione S-transferase Gst2-like [Schizosaccharomyces osmophilus]|uniref:Glutathione S-transferase Gst2-like n=1 Tax=Schizosaccharomyces osmophilus TaxID=2545709 RepID=A0AAE9W953_9SCHI|nr:glutathione S-transferase Gst2-like [Schizosaccharomyces osmophilus]WBW72037.1 glutathione S-transferase Gst2-like [Schizosaccharomyces osmophilus]